MIAPRLIEWQRRHGRHQLPWQNTRDAYRIWLSEVMLQQTQVGTVVPYYLRFVERFPDVASLAAADDEEVLALWSGLGYYSRARNLHRCAREVVTCHGGAFPDDPARLAALPGIGRSTAAAIAVFAFGRRAAILDGNVRRVLCRHAGVRGYPGERAVEDTLWRIAENELPLAGVEPYTQGLMDLGAMLCTRTRPSCTACPIGADCSAHRDGTVAELPAPRPRRSVPVRRCEMFVVRCGDEVLLERRPPSGIWGGLWSLPQSSLRDAGAGEAHAAARTAVADRLGACADVGGDGSDDFAQRQAVAEIERRFGLQVTPARPLAAFDHAFTHFRLRVQPLACEVLAATAAAQSPGHAWLPLADCAAAALPRPVKSLLAALPLRSPDAAEDTGTAATGA